MTKQELALQKLGLTSAEIADVIASDAAIDKGEKLFELTAEQKQAEKAAKAVGIKTTVAERKPKAQKQDDDKVLIINTLANALPVPVDVTNSQREFTFTFNNKLYKVVLSCPRKV